MKILEILTRRRITGNIGEDAAARHLRRQRYRILCRNYVGAGYEIDLVAENRDTTVFAEVKTRTLGHEDPREPRPAAALTKQKQQKILAAARDYLSVHPRRDHIRFDVIEVILTDGPRPKVHRITHMPAAFDKHSAYAHKKY